MCTMDYVSYVLGLQGWQRCICINDYMAGWESSTNDGAARQYAKSPQIASRTDEIACQTPREWSILEEPEKAEEAAPESAPVRLVVLRPGMQAPNPPSSRPREIW